MRWKQFWQWGRRLVSPGETLSSRVVVSGVWVFLLRVFSRVVVLARTIVLARILAPDDFGLLGITLVGMSILETFSQTGFQAALIQKKENIEAYLDTAWTTLALRGVALYALLFFGAPYVAAFYETPQAADLFRVIGLVMILEGLSNIRVIYFKKELEFQKQFVFRLTGTLVDLVVSVAAAILLRNVWALIYGQVAGSLARLIVSYIIDPRLPRPQIDLSRLREMYGFGRWVFGTSIFIFLLTEGDDAFVGKVVGVAALGFYQMAYRIGNLPATEITHVISQITFPAFAKLQENQPGLRDAYLRVLKLTALISLPLAGGIFVLAPDVTRILLGDEWLPMVGAMQVLVIGGAVRSIGATMGPVFQAVGRPQILTRLLFVQTLLVAALIYPLTIWLNITGTALSMMIPGLIINLAFAFIVTRITHSQPSRIGKAVGFPLLSTLVMVGSLYVLKSFVLPDVGVASLLLLAGLGAAVYFGGIYFLERYFGYQVFSVLRTIRTSFQRASSA